mgnify:CR=1 FL=1
MKVIVSDKRSALARRVRFSPAGVSGRADVVEAADIAYRRKQQARGQKRTRRAARQAQTERVIRQLGGSRDEAKG